MNSKNQSKTVLLSKQQLVIAFMVSLVVLTLNVASFDPFNIPKFVTLALTAFISLFMLLQFPPILNSFDRILILACGLFLAGLVASSLSHRDIWKSMIGTYGRNMGMLTYFFLIIVFLSVAFSKNQKNLSFNHLFTFLPLCLFLIFYGLIQNSGDDPFRWNNPYSPIIGTFGNPNFMSAFLGISIVICVAILINKQSLSLGWRVIVVTSIASSVFLILKSQSIQGLLFAYLGLLTMAYLNFKGDFKMRILVQSFTIISASLGILGLLNRGFLAEYLYAPSISARGDYWRAAVQMSRDFPFFGVGIEKFGEFFSQYRDIQQVQGRNWATYSDNAHNVFLQIASTSGLFTAFSLVLVHFLVWGKAISRIRTSVSVEENKSLIALLSISVASSAPMLISVDNIGIAVLSWFNLGLLYCGTRPSAHNNNQTLFRNKSSYVVSSFTSFSLLIVLTVLVLFPVAKADLEFTQYMKQSTSSSWNMVQQDAFFNSINKLRPSEYRYQILFARKYSEMGNLKKSREIYFKLTENSPNSAEIFRMIAQTFEAEGNTIKELEFRVKSQELDFYRMDNLLSIVKGYVKLGKEQEALKYFNIMKKALPQYPYTIEAQQTILESFPDR